MKVWAAVALVIASGCAGSVGGTLTPNSSVDTAAVARSTKLIAVSDDEDLAVGIYNTSGQVVAVLSGFGFPQGLANDSKGDLFVADQTNSRIQVYAAGFKTSPTSLSDPGQYPAAVAVFGNGSIVAAVNQYTTSYGPGSVTMYSDGVPAATVTNARIGQASFAAFDNAGNLFVTFAPRGGTCPCVGEIAGAAQGGTTLTALTTSNAISPNGIAVTASGDIALFDETKNAVDTYGPPTGGTLGAPLARTVLRGTLDAPAQFAFASDMNDLYIANNSDNNSLFEFGYPSGAAVASIPIGGLPYGVAIYPKVLPR
jgi:sugar lactone lactonase YvrE